MTEIERDVMEYDVVIVGAGPAGLATAIHLKQLAKSAKKSFEICVLEKASECGAHTLSGAVIDPAALTELFPNWKEKDAPLRTPVSEDQFLFLSQKSAMQVPNFLLPKCFHNTGNYVASLANVVRWMSDEAQLMGIDVFAGFPAAHLLYDTQGAVKGVQTGDMGVDRNGEKTANFQPGIQLIAKYTIFAEGSRGHLGKQLIQKFKLSEGRDPQTYSLGIKELWEIDPAKHKPGLVVHTAGWPLNNDTYGGSFLYHLENNQVSIGFVVGLGYENPYLSPFEEFQRYKTHPAIQKHLSKGKRIAYGARAITVGGLMALPKLVFPGGALVGCEAGFLNTSRIKGSHAAIKSGMLCAQALFDALSENREKDELSAYPESFHNSWLFHELYRARNFKQWMNKGLISGTLMVGIEQKLFNGKVPWTLHNKKPDHKKLKKASEFSPIDYPKPDGKVSFDRLSSVYLSNTNHEENQPNHLTLKDESIPVKTNLADFNGPEQFYCPAGVYEYVKSPNGENKLHINAQNCVHCKTCDIKDPTQNIEWVTPEGSGGPNYPNM